MKGNITRDMSLRHIKAIRAIKDLDVSPYNTSRDEDSYLLIKDPHADSNFFFKIDDVDTHSDTTIQYTILYSPYVEYTLDISQVKIKDIEFKTYFAEWSRLIEMYAVYLEESTQESIIEGYENEYFAEYELVDEDADTHSYSTNNQQNIEDFLKNVADRLKRYTDEENLSDDVVDEINKLINDIEQLITTQTRQTKRQVFNKIVNIVARCRKAAPKIIKEIGFEILKSLIVDSIKDPEKLLEAAKNILGP